MPEDFRGVPVSAQSDAALAAGNDFNQRLVRLDTGVGKIFEAHANEPDDPLLNLYAAMTRLYAQTDESTLLAGELLDKVAKKPSRLTARDSLFLEGLQAFQARQYYLAQDRFEELTEDFPRDLLGAKFCEYVYYVMGQHHSGPRFRKHMERLASDNADDPDFLGMHAFACELSDDLKAGEAIARQAIEREPRNPWAQHALSHVLIRAGRTEAGIKEMEDFLPLLKTCDRLILCHDGWHLALLYLEQLDEANARRIFNETVWAGSGETVAEQIDAISFAWRMEMAGLTMGDFWKDVTEKSTPRAGEAFMPFLSAQYAYAFAKAGRDDLLSELLEVTSQRALGKDDEAKRIWAPVGRSLIEASAACGEGHPHEAVAFMKPIIERVACVGGSDAQDDLFRLAYVDALVDSGNRTEAEAFRSFWQPDKAASPLDERLVSAK